MRFLPKTANNQKGFTLIELMVVIAIIAILAVVGVTVYNGTQKSARDARRRADVDAITSAIESAKTANTNVYAPVTGAANFAGGSMPVDTSTAKYSILTRTDGTTPAQPTVWLAASTSPTAVEGSGTTVAVMADSLPGATVTNWRICALLETGSNPANIYCRASSQ